VRRNWRPPGLQHVDDAVGGPESGGPLADQREEAIGTELAEHLALDLAQHLCLALPVALGLAQPGVLEREGAQLREGPGYLDLLGREPRRVLAPDGQRPVWAVAG
jgi:hypothetical protein